MDFDFDGSQSLKFKILSSFFFFNHLRLKQNFIKQYFALTWYMLETLTYEEFYYVCNGSFEIKSHFIYCSAFFYVSEKYGGEYCLRQLNCFCYLSQQLRQDENPFMYKIPLHRLIEKKN